MGSKYVAGQWPEGAGGPRKLCALVRSVWKLRDIPLEGKLERGRESGWNSGREWGPGSGAQEEEHRQVTRSDTRDGSVDGAGVTERREGTACGSTLRVRVGKGWHSRQGEKSLK